MACQKLSPSQPSPSAGPGEILGVRHSTTVPLLAFTVEISAENSIDLNCKTYLEV